MMPHFHSHKLYMTITDAHKPNFFGVLLFSYRGCLPTRNNIPPCLILYNKDDICVTPDS